MPRKYGELCIKECVALSSPEEIRKENSREITLDLAAATGVPNEERVLYPEELQDADELFITSSLKELAPVVTLDGKPIADGKPGPVTKALLKAYRART